MAELKTKPTGQDVSTFLASIPDEERRQDCLTLVELMRKVTGAEPRLWGDGIVGFGDYHYKYASGREGDWFITGFAPRKQNLTVYVWGYLEQYGDLRAGLGKHKEGKGCLYINRLADISLPALEKMLQASVTTAQRYGH